MMESSCKDWYVLQSTPGKEKKILQYVNKYAGKTTRTIIFSRELLHFKNGTYINVVNTLFPGYIFVHKHIYDILKLFKNSDFNEFIRAVSFNGKPAKVHKHEMAFLLKHSDKNGLFRLSTGVKNGNKIIITKGPLKQIKSNIKFINEKKKKVKIELYLFDKKFNVNLGMDLMRISHDHIKSECICF